MSLAALTICKHCVYDGRLGPNCIRCVNGSKFKNKAELDKGDEWDTYCRNDVESTRKMILATTNPYRDERITKDVLDSFAYCYKIDKEFDCGLAKIVEEVKEKENMNIWTNSGNIKLTVNDRVCKVDSWEIEETCSPYDMPRIRLEATMTRSAIPYNECSKKKKEEAKMPTIKNVVFNPPATIVFWADGTKTVVKASNEEFDAEKGLAMAITKKMLGNTGHYFETVKKWTKNAPNGECVTDLIAVYNQGKDDKWAEVEAKLTELMNNLVVGNRVTKKFYNEFLNILMPNKQSGEA